MVDSCRIVEREVAPSRSAWLFMCGQSDNATFFHTPYWAELFEGGFGNRYRAASELLRFDDDSTLFLPLVIHRRFGGLFRTACSSPGGTFGGWLSTGPVSPAKEVAATAGLGRFANLILRENPYQPQGTPIPGCRCVEEYTRTVDLTPGYDTVWMRATAAHRNAVRNAVRRGVEIHEAVTHTDWETYAAVYLRSIDRWKTRNIFTGAYYPPVFFNLIERLDTSLRTLFLATVKGVVVAGILCFRWNRHMAVWHGAGLGEYFSYHPNNLLYDRAIAHAAGGGCAWLDCNPSAGLTGVDKFKQYLGADKRRCRLFVRRSPAAVFFDRLRGRGGS